MTKRGLKWSWNLGWLVGNSTMGYVGMVVRMRLKRFIILGTQRSVTEGSKFESRLVADHTM